MKSKIFRILILIALVFFISMGFVCAGEASDDMANDSQIEGSYDINDEPALSGVDEFEDSQLNSANELEEIDADFF